MIFLYRIYDQAGTLLYVGQTKNLRKRMNKHRMKFWRDEIDYVTTEHFSSREAAVAAERVAIRTERPRYNADLVTRDIDCAGDRNRCKCWDCRQYRSKKMIAYRKTKRGQEPPSHGTTYGYVHFGCRCDPCSEAKNASDRAGYRRQRDGISA